MSVVCVHFVFAAEIPEKPVLTTLQELLEVEAKDGW